jgi:hypothetical protein
MPYTEVMHKWKHGLLHSGSSKGPKVGNQKQAIAIMLSEKRAAKKGKKEYQSHGVGPSSGAAEDMISSSAKKRKR